MGGTGGCYTLSASAVSVFVCLPDLAHLARPHPLATESPTGALAEQEFPPGSQYAI